MPKIYLGSLPEPINCKSFTLTFSTKPNPDMNAEQLARDIKSLDQAHRAADEALKPYPGLSIGAKVESLAASYEALKAQQPVDDFSSKVRSEIRSEISSSLGKSCLEVRSLTTQNLVHMLIDRLRALKAEQGNNISIACSQRIHEQLSRVGIAPYAKLDVLVKELVDELLKLRQQGAHAAGHIHDLNKQLEALKAEQGEIRRKVAEALGKDALEIRALTTQEIVYTLIYRLGETKQGETNNSRLEEEDRLEIREKLITALGCGRFTSTVAMVDLVLGELQHTRAEAASDTAKNFNASILRLKAKADFEELKQEHQKLSEKHQELHSNYKLLQALSIGQPKGLAPEKEKWVATPSQCSSRYAGLFRVMRDNEDATPHPVSKAVAEAIAMELNGR